MPDVIEKFIEYDMVSLATELGGILFTPSVFVNCLISSCNRSSLYDGAVLNILGRSPDFMLTGYMIEIDKNIVRDNLENARTGGYITQEKFGIVEGALNRLKTLPCCPCIELEANIRSKSMALYDARRLETAFQHNLTVLTSELEDFTSDPDELNHIFKHEYADIVVGQAIDIDSPSRCEEYEEARVWLFKPEALATLLNRFNPNSRICMADRQIRLRMDDFSLSCQKSGSQASIKMYLDGELLTGSTIQVGPIDALLRAIEESLKAHINLVGCDVHHRVSDTTTERDSIRVRIRLTIPERLSRRLASPINCIEASDESQNMLESTARAYIKALNTLLREIGV